MGNGLPSNGSMSVDIYKYGLKSKYLENITKGRCIGINTVSSEMDSNQNDPELWLTFFEWETWPIPETHEDEQPSTLDFVINSLGT